VNNHQKEKEQLGELLEKIIKEEKYLFIYATAPFNELKDMEEKIEKHPDAENLDYSKLIQKAGVDKIRVLFFAR